LALVTIYRDPSASDYPHPRLFVDLMARPSRIDLLPLELQVTSVIAWLADRSRPFALALLEEFIGSAHGAGDRAIGARIQITLPRVPPDPPLYPDISIDVGERALQLLVEVKVDATFHTHVLKDGTFLQPETYVLVWKHAAELSGENEAMVRRVGTLSRTPGNAPKPDPALGDADTRRAADISWRAVRDLIDNAIHTGDFGELDSVAQEFVEALDNRVLGPAGEIVISDPVLAWGFEMLADVLPSVAIRVFGASLGYSVAPQPDYIGRYLQVDFGLPSPVRFWIYVTTAAGRYNGGRAEANLWLSESPDSRDARASPEVRKQLATAGFSEVTDAAGAALRRALPLAQIRVSGKPDEERKLAVEWIIRSLRQAGARILA
jgi:hypothetical protein